MAANTSPIFVGTPKNPHAHNTTANVNRDGATGSYTTLYTAGANGSFFKALRIQYDVAPSAGDVVRIFYQPNGGTLFLRKEIIIPPTNPATSASNAIPTPTLPEFVWTGAGEVRDPAGNLIQPGVGITMGGSDVIKVTTDQGKSNVVSLEGGGDY